jgi:hypothetical protein
VLVHRPAPPGIRPFLEINGQYKERQLRVENSSTHTPVYSPDAAQYVGLRNPTRPLG